MRGGLVSQADARFFGDAVALGEGKGFCCLLPVLLDVVATAADAAAASGWPLQPFVSGESDVDSRRTKLIMPARLSSGPQRAWARARCAMPRVNLMALDEHPSCLHPRFGYATAFFPRSTSLTRSHSFFHTMLLSFLLLHLLLLLFLLLFLLYRARLLPIVRLSSPASAPCSFCRRPSVFIPVFHRRLSSRARFFLFEARPK